MTNKHNDGRVSRELKCWSCNAVFTLSEHGNCDGCCWKCGVEIDLAEMDIQPADQQAEPVAITELRHIFDCNKGADRTLVISKKLAAQLLADQPATTKVVLPERLDLPHREEFESADQHAAAVGEAKNWNACLDEVAKLNGVQS